MLKEMTVKEMANTNGGIVRTIQIVRTAYDVVKTAVKVTKYIDKSVANQTCVQKQWTNPTSSNYSSNDYRGGRQTGDQYGKCW